MRPVGFAYRFGDRQLNVHGPGVAPAEVARLPVAPGNSDLCFEWNGPIAEAIAHLERCGVAVEAGPMQRFGAKGAGTSVYFRDPDGSLMEFMSYVGAQTMRGSTRQARPDLFAPDIPIPRDDGGARHLTRMKLPDLPLPATRGGAFNLSIIAGRTVLYIYPRTGVPGVELPPGWDDIPGRARLHAAILRLSRSFRRTQRAGRRPRLRPVDAGHRLSARGRRAAAPAVPNFVRRGAEIYPRAEIADVLRRRHDAAQAHGARGRRRRHQQGVLSSVSARQERRRSRGVAARQR